MFHLRSLRAELSVCGLLYVLMETTAEIGNVLLKDTASPSTFKLLAIIRKFQQRFKQIYTQFNRNQVWHN